MLNIFQFLQQGVTKLTIADTISIKFKDSNLGDTIFPVVNQSQHVLPTCFVLSTCFQCPFRKLPMCLGAEFPHFSNGYELYSPSCSRTSTRFDEICGLIVLIGLIGLRSKEHRDDLKRALFLIKASRHLGCSSCISHHGRESDRHRRAPQAVCLENQKQKAVISDDLR